MTSEQFAYWLQGYAELNPDNPPTAEQWVLIREHLSLVFKKVTPQLGGIKKFGPNHEMVGPNDSSILDWWNRQAQCAATPDDRLAYTYC